MLAEKYDSPYSKVMELLRSCVMCLCGARLSLRHPWRIDMGAVDLVTVEGLVTS